MKSSDYFELLERLVKGAEFLSNPFLKENQRRQYQHLYDEIERRIMKYKGYV